MRFPSALSYYTFQSLYVRRIIILFFLTPLLAAAQINTDRVMLIGRNALYYDDYVLSIQYFNEVINAKPFLYEPYYFRAIAKFYLEDYSGAENDCSEAIKLNPFIEDAYQLRGLCRIKGNKLEEAIADYTQVIEYKPLEQASWHNRVLCRIQLKDYDTALEELHKMEAQWPSYIKSYGMEAHVLLQMTDTVRADSMFCVAIEKNPKDGDSWGARGMIYYNRGAYAEADTCLTHAIEYSADIPDYYINRALVRYQQRDLRGAMNDYDSALAIDTANFLAHYNRGLLRARVGEDNKAIYDFNFVLRLEPDNLLALFNRAVLLENTGNYRAAITDVSKVIADYPHFWTGYELRARCLRKVGRNREALRDERKVLAAQLDRTFNNKHYANKSTRKRRELNIDDYRKIVVDEDQDIGEKYANDYRGKVQNRKVEAVAQPMFAFSTAAVAGGRLQRTAFWAEADKWNELHLTTRGITLTNKVKPAETSYINVLFADINALSNAIEADKSLTNERLARAILYSDARDYTSALNDLNEYIAKDTASAMAYMQRAAVRQRLAETERANDDDTPAQSSAAVEWKAVLGDMDCAARLLPKNAAIRYNRGCANFALKDYTHAIDDFTQALTLDAGMAEAYYNRALAYLALEKKSEALEDLSKAGELGIYDAYSIIKQNSR